MENNASTESRTFDIELSSLSARAQNCCRSIGVSTIEELAQYAANHDINNIRNCGMKTVMELKELLAAYGHGEPNLFNQRRMPSRVIPLMLEEPVNEEFDKALTGHEAEVKSVFATAFPDADAFFSAVLEAYAQLFRRYDGLSLDQHEALWDSLLAMMAAVDGLPARTRAEIIFLRRVNKAYTQCKERRGAMRHSLLFSYVTPQMKPIIDREYEMIVASMSTRTRNLIKDKNIRPEQALDVPEMTLRDRLFARGFGKGCIAEAKEKFEGFEKYLRCLISQNDSDPDEIENLSVKARYPFLAPEQIAETRRLVGVSGHTPYFYLMYCAIGSSGDRETAMYNQAMGITCDRLTQAEIAERSNLTRERVRQIVIAYPFNALAGIKSGITAEQYPFLDLDFININAEAPRLAEREFETVPGFGIDAFAGLVSLVKDFSRQDFGNVSYLVARNLDNAMSWRMIWEKMGRRLRCRAVTDVDIPADEFIEGVESVDPAYLPAARRLIGEIAQANFDATADVEGIVTMRKNALDIEDELYQILQANGAPMHFDDISAAFFAKFSDRATPTPSTLRFYLFNSTRILTIGKTSTHALAEWGCSVKPLRGEVADILQDSDEPLHIDTIVEILEERGRHPNKSSIYSSIMTDSKHNFVKFKGNYIGLGDKIYDERYILMPPESIMRKPFDVKLREFLNFLDTERHFPRSNKEGDEGVLYRWYNHVIRGSREVTPEQLATLNEEVAKREADIMTSGEYTFSLKCQAYRDHVESTGRKPTIDSAPSLYNWFTKARRERDTLSPKSAAMLDDLIEWFSDTMGLFSNL